MKLVSSGVSVFLTLFNPISLTISRNSERAMSTEERHENYEDS